MGYLNSRERLLVRLGRMQRIVTADGERFQQKGVDTLIVIDALRLAMSGQIDRLVVVTGDSDLAPLLATVRDMGVEVELVYDPDTPVHPDLLEAADECTEIDDALFDAVLQDEDHSASTQGRNWQNKKNVQTLRSVLEAYAEHQAECEEEEGDDQEEAA